MKFSLLVFLAVSTVVPRLSVAAAGEGNLLGPIVTVWTFGRSIVVRVAPTPSGYCQVIQNHSLKV